MECRRRLVRLPAGDDLDGYWEAYAGFNAGNFGFKQWFADDFYAPVHRCMYTEANYTQAASARSSRWVSTLGYSWGDYWEDSR